MTTDTQHIHYATVILPLAVPKTYSYIIPEEALEQVQFGIRVEVPLRNKLYSAIVIEISKDLELSYKAKTIISVIDDAPIISHYQFTFWKWLASYYCSTIGEVMNVALPSGLKLSSETKVVVNPLFNENYSDLTDSEYLVAEAISIQNELSIEQVKDILNRKTVYPIIRNLLDRQVLYIKEELKEKFKAKTISAVEWTSHYKGSQERINEAFDLVRKSDLQTKALLAYVKLSRGSSVVPVSGIYELADVSSAIINALVKKEILRKFKKIISRLDEAEDEEFVLQPFSDQQEKALSEIKDVDKAKAVTLLHGVTGSGKTRVYLELIQEAIDAGQQVLYLLPEIGLTTQIVQRLKAAFGNNVGLYHSRMNNHERVELWNAVMIGKQLILGARSALMLPFSNLGLIIVDEEHDPSYKQNDPNPRYNARDAAIYLAGLFKARVILGSATPSLESIYNAQQGKYGYVVMNERFGNVELPFMDIVDLRTETKTGRLKSYFSKHLRDEITDALMRGEQALIFQNRRGFSPSIHCEVCGWTGECSNCDVSLTYHKFFDELKCHYCGYRSKMPKACPACGHDELKQMGFGTEKIETVIHELFPKARVARMDYDTVKSRSALEKIIYAFEDRKIDILVGTQMITKGLDFDNIAVVGVLNADMLIRFPDLRAHERAFQLLIQVAGRAGRRSKQGRVVIQTYDPQHPIILEVVNNNYDRFFKRELAERKKFYYPPFFRLIHIHLKHKKPQIVAEAAQVMAGMLTKVLGKRVIGPAAPGIARVRGQYLQNITIKIEKNPKAILKAKEIVLEAKSELKNITGFKSVRVNIDVDPY